jgi:hypothetical protein
VTTRRKRLNVTLMIKMTLETNVMMLLMKMTLMTKMTLKTLIMRLLTNMMLKATTVTTMMTTIRKMTQMVKMMLSGAKMLMRLWRNLRQTRRSGRGTKSTIDTNEHVLNPVVVVVVGLHHTSPFFGIL